ncbi:MAG: hypothetical protein WA855_16660 [Candidatus Acidiferrales bacterium]
MMRVAYCDLALSTFFIRCWDSENPQELVGSFRCVLPIPSLSQSGFAQAGYKTGIETKLARGFWKRHAVGAHLRDNVCNPDPGVLECLRHRKELLRGVRSDSLGSGAALPVLLGCSSPRVFTS